MSAVMEMHERWLAARSRLGVGHHFEAPPDRPKLVTLPKRKLPRTVPDAAGFVPINLLSFHNWRFLIQYAAVKAGVSHSDLMGNSRLRKFTLARYHAIWLLVTHSSMTQAMVSAKFGKHPTTIAHALKLYCDSVGIECTFRQTRVDADAERAERNKVILTMYRKGRSRRVIAAKVKMTTRGVGHVIREHVLQGRVTLKSLANATPA